MGALIRVAITVLSGIGLGDLLNKFFPGKLPVDTQPLKSEGGFLKNAAILIALSLVGTMIAKWIVRKAKLTRQIKLGMIPGMVLGAGILALGVYMTFFQHSAYGLAILIFTAPGGIGTPFTFNMTYLPEWIQYSDGGNPLTNLRIETQEDGVLHNWDAGAIAAMDGFLNVGAQPANQTRLTIANGNLQGRQVTISGVTSAVGAIAFFVSSDNIGTNPFTTSLTNILPNNDTEFKAFSALFLPNLVTLTDRIQVFYMDGHQQTYDPVELAGQSSMYQEVQGIVLNNAGSYINKVIVTSALGGAAYKLSVKI